MEEKRGMQRMSELECFTELDRRVTKLGFGTSRREEIRSEMWRKMVTLNPELKETMNEGPTVVYSYTSSASRMTAKLCSGFLLQTGKFHKRGYMFCLIENEEGYAVYWATLTRRTLTAAMIERAVMRAWLCMERVRHAPVCADPECRTRYQFRSYKYVSGRRCYWWQCPNVDHHGHGKCPSESPDYGLPEPLIAFVQRERASRDRDAEDPRRVTPRSSGFGNRIPTWEYGQPVRV